MAAVTPISKGTAGWVHPFATLTNSGSSTQIGAIGDGNEIVYAFVAASVISDGDTYTITTWRGLPPKYVRWHSNAAAGDTCTPTFSLSGTTLTVTFNTDASTSSGYLVIGKGAQAY